MLRATSKNGLNAGTLKNLQVAVNIFDNLELLTIRRN